MKIRKQQYQVLVICLAILLAFAAGPTFADESDHKVQSFLDNVDPNQRLNVSHIHGAGFADNDLIVATHLGLVRYHDGGWVVVDSPPHDFMGFAMTGDGAYFSGHPSVYLLETIPNPMGVMYSKNLGKDLEKRAYVGEIDFHWLTAGYSTSSVFALTPRSPITGLPMFVASGDKGNTWSEKYLKGISGTFLDIAAHPTQKNIIYLLTSDGVYRSEDSGGWFGKITTIDGGRALASSGNGRSVYIGGRTLVRTNGNGRSKTDLAIPEMETGDSILEIAAGPEGSGYLAYVTEFLNVYLSKDDGRRWEKILTKGKASEKTPSH